MGQEEAGGALVFIFKRAQCLSPALLCCWTETLHSHISSHCLPSVLRELKVVLLCWGLAIDRYLAKESEFWIPASWLAEAMWGAEKWGLSVLLASLEEA